MDGLTDNSSLLPIVLLIDHVDRAVHDGVLPSVGLLCLLLFYFAFFGRRLDWLLVLFFAFWKNSSALLSWISYSEAAKLSLTLSLAFAVAGICLGPVLASFSASDLAWDGSGRPLLIPSRTSHARMFPKKHSFSYSYLVAGVPVGSKGNVNGVLSIDEQETSRNWFRRAWYAVDSGDYLQRGADENGLRGKLNNYLKSQGAHPADYPHAYLVTAARFLGYHFNPVSFWYLYSSDKILSAIILEVNNTFGERRPYFVTRDFAEEAKYVSATRLPNDDAHTPRVRKTWSKDFHVSPFNSRKGTYSLLAADPWGPNMETFRGINVTINLISSKGRPKLVAQLFSEGEAIDPSKMSIGQKIAFVANWFWVGLVTFPRIAKQAGALFFKRKLHVWYRPEPLKDSLGRMADRTERCLEAAFRQYLHHLVEQSPNPLSVKYIPSGIADRAEETFTSQTSSDSSEGPEFVEIKILTPVFYSRFVHYAHDSEAIFSELAENCTISIDKPHILPKVFLKKASPPLHASSVADFVYFKAIQRLRRRPDPIQRPMTSAQTTTASSVSTVDIRGFRISPMDAFVLEQDDTQLKATYRAAVLRLFMADRLFLGSMELLDTAEFLWRGCLSWALASGLTSLAETIVV